MMVDSFLPAMREAVAKKLVGEGYSQGRVAALLGVTQASVSLYVKFGGRSSSLLARLGISEEQGALYASLLAEDLKKSPVYAVNTLYSLWSDALGRGALCGSHRKEYPALSECSMCVVKFGPQLEPSGDAVEQVASAVRVLEGSSAFVSVMPEVSVNIAYAPLGAKSAQDVVAVPGRIVKVKGMPRSFMKPEYGASTHVANVLLAVLSSDETRRAAMNIRYDAKIDSVIRKMKLGVLRVKGGSLIVEGLRDTLNKVDRQIDALVDPGGPGSEPGLYLFGEDAMAVAELGVKVARSCAASR
jgi:predicted fused transcriptional regulator/phosphomethylpyrimidine kinase/predicted transcriptional regulator